MEKTTDLRIRIIEGFSSNGCPLCTMLRQDEFDSLCQWVGCSDNSTEESVQIRKLTDAGGFCNYHFWRFQEMSTPYGCANICAQLIDKLLGIPRTDKQKASRFIACPLCVELREKESVYLRELSVVLKHNEYKLRYGKSCGLCIPHYTQTIDYIDDSFLLTFLYETQVAQLEKVKADAASFVNKRQPPLRWEQTDDERISWFRAIEKIVGRSGT